MPPSRLLLLPLLLTLASCGLLENRLVLTPRGSFRDGAEQGDARVHAPSVRCELECAFVEEDEGLVPQRGFQVTFYLDNDGSQPIELDWAGMELIDDQDHRFRPTRSLRWNEDDENYTAAPTGLRPGDEAVLVALFPVDAGLRLQHLFRITLHWSYRVGAEKYRIRSHFDMQ